MKYDVNSIEITLKDDHHSLSDMIEIIMLAMTQLKADMMPTYLNMVVGMFSMPDSMSTMLTKLARGHDNDAESLLLAGRLLDAIFKAFDDCADLNHYKAIFEYETLATPTPMSVLWDM